MNMMYENDMKNIQKVVKEKLELEFYELRGDGMRQFQVKKIDGKELAADEIILITLKTNLNEFMGGRAYLALDLSNYHGKLEVFYCKKKKGLFKKESLEVINSVRKSFHIDALERGEEEMISLTELMKK